MRLHNRKLASFAAAVGIIGGASVASVADVMLPVANVITADAKATQVGDGVRVDFGRSSDWPNVRWAAPTAAGWDWSSNTAIVLTLRNLSATDAELFVRIDQAPASDGKRKGTSTGLTLAGGETTSFFCPLASYPKPPDTGMRQAPPPMDPTIGTPLRFWDPIDPKSIESVQIFVRKSANPPSIEVKSVKLTDTALTRPLARLIDRYGQFTQAEWPGKVHADADLAASLASERDSWRKMPAMSGRDRWGGWASGPKVDATGFFRTAQVDGRWWFVDPDGRLFLSTGIDNVAPSTSTVIEGREAMYEWLPDAGDPLCGHTQGHYSEGQLFNGKTFDFYGANLRRKYGADYRTAFRQSAISRLTSWGFNTIGNWSDEAIGRDNHFPYVATVWVRGEYSRVSSYRDGSRKIVDPFDPAFATALEATLAEKAKLIRDDPACLGYFVDNEMEWAGGDADGQHFGIAYGTLGSPATCFAKQAFIAALRAKYGDVQALNVAWGETFASWDDLGAPRTFPTPLKTDAQRKDFSLFVTQFAERYFQTVTSSLHRIDPNHLYLGCRFRQDAFSEEVVQACAKYADVVSFNIYRRHEYRMGIVKGHSKPVLVGEFHFGALDRGMFSGGCFPVTDQKTRAARFEDYVDTTLADPAFVGCHWFQFFDEPTSGRAGDGENFNIGFVSITDTPYPELVTAARAANSRIYAVHSGSGVSKR
ncbi:MAG TPA: beta-galactosidase [Capsulimonadaceae bacterium]|jgi:hypothetical protein